MRGILARARKVGVSIIHVFKWAGKLRKVWGCVLISILSLFGVFAEHNLGLVSRKDAGTQGLLRKALALELLLECTYHLRMTFDFLLKAVERLLHKGQRSADSARDEAVEDDEPWDPENPFPEVVAIEFKDVLDLHSIPPRQVRAVVEEYVREAQRRRVRWVRIIHGKGVGVQREMVRSILACAPCVVEYKDAPAEAGGWGATVVTLARELAEP